MTTIEQQDAAELRARMVAGIDELGLGYLRLARVGEAMLTVERHRFVPHVSLADAYADRAVTTKPGQPGQQPQSCASQPSIVAMMLDQLDPKPGGRILEIGAGTGYNAALLAELVKPAGHVVTIDVTPEVTAGARAALDATGYDRVHVVTGDGAEGVPESAPYDGIIVTVGPWDLPPAWTAQLVEGGRLVVPLKFRGNSRGIVFVKDGQILRATSSRLCGFIPMTGPKQDGERRGQLDTEGEITLTWDLDQQIDTAELAGVLDRPAGVIWTGTVMRYASPFDGLWLRLAADEPRACRLTVGNGATAVIEAPVIPARTPAVVGTGSLAYLVQREIAADVDGTRRFELGAAAYGSTDPAERLRTHIQAWDADRDAHPTIYAYPADTPTEDLPCGGLIDKPSNRLVISYS
ncbi:methyltransferase, FxLD system [Actinokineospora enzanensis]|uniref:methyltransferase, FxLD system n=1 Tax=Actinokineospora enzanensis TaxID=155975 RepID=UPI00038251B2|nr:methyltransferase, FxLD system [Actinokineospora enzanensis]